MISSLIRVFQSLEVRFDNKQVTKLSAVVSNVLDLMVGMVTCCRVPGPPAFLVNVENWEWPGGEAKPRDHLTQKQNRAQTCNTHRW